MFRGVNPGALVVAAAAAAAAAVADGLGAVFGQSGNTTNTRFVCVVAGVVALGLGPRKVL